MTREAEQTNQRIERVMEQREIERVKNMASITGVDKGLGTVADFMADPRLSRLPTGLADVKTWGKLQHQEGTFDLTFQHMNHRVDAVKKKQRAQTPKLQRAGDLDQ